MGVPAFYRWLSERYPNIVIYAKEDSDPSDLNQPNPNGFEIDNLYLDMNCLIHPCTHPEDGAAPATEEEMFSAVFRYVDRLIALVRPRKILYLAIDGVAPRAKMNQQRSRRFRSAQESEEAFEMEKKMRKELLATGQKVPPEAKKPWDHNVITPGTPFMSKLSKRFREYILLRQNKSPFWKRLKVVYSDGNAPGEGEHKLMDFIRRQRQQAHHDPNTVHCLYGLDADLIMLGLATHEVNFLILREEVLFGRKKREKESFKVDQVLQSRIPGASGEERLVAEQYDLLKKQKKPFQFLKISVLREYLSYEFGQSQFYSPLKFTLELERCIDDFVFLCFFVGNDFLPHLPTLSIREGGLELLMDLYKRFLPTLSGYLTNCGFIYLDRVQVVLEALSKVEDEIFRRRRNFEKNMQRRRAERKQNQSSLQQKNQESLGFKATLKEKLREKNSFKVVEEGEVGEKGEAAVVDSVRLGLPGWKKRYYQKKFVLETAEEVIAFQKEIAREYVKGLVWVFLYYYKGCQSWSWFYPFHYAPFASDLTSIGSLQETLYAKDEKGVLSVFGITKPSSPYEQLLGVLPSQSAHALPKPFQWFMRDEDSPIIRFYPTDFKYDPNGKGVKWLWIALLPFIEEKEIKKVMKAVEPKLSAKEKKRNMKSSPLLFLHSETDYGRELLGKLSLLMKGDTSSSVQVKGEALNGFLQSFASKFAVKAPIKSKNPFLGGVHCNKVFLSRYTLPVAKKSFKYGSNILPGARLPKKILSERDVSNIAERSPRRGHFIGGIYGEMFGQGQKRRRGQPPTSWGSLEPRQKSYLSRSRGGQRHTSSSRSYMQQDSGRDGYHAQRRDYGRENQRQNLYNHYNSQSSRTYHQSRHQREPYRGSRGRDHYSSGSYNDGQRRREQNSRIDRGQRGAPSDVLKRIEERLKRRGGS